MKKNDFASGVLERLTRLEKANTSDAIKASGYQQRSDDESRLIQAPPVGHPAFAHLRIGQSAICSLAVAFLDMRAMTPRSFWLPLEKVSRLTLAVLGQVAEVVQESGGHVLGMRGDGLMAGWGEPHSDGDLDVAMAMAACSFALDAVENALNQVLALDGVEPVQLCAGADFGQVCFTRTGAVGASEVNIVGHPANFAAKCEKHALAWEVVVGEGAAAAIRPGLLTQHEKSPKVYTRLGQRRSYAFYEFAWRQITPDAAGAISQVGGRPTGSVDPHWKEIVQ
jgi:adenylate cyclase